MGSGVGVGEGLTVWFDISRRRLPTPLGFEFAVVSVAREMFRRAQSVSAGSDRRVCERLPPHPRPLSPEGARGDFDPGGIARGCFSAINLLPFRPQVHVRWPLLD